MKAVQNKEGQSALQEQHHLSDTTTPDGNETPNKNILLCAVKSFPLMTDVLLAKTFGFFCSVLFGGCLNWCQLQVPRCYREGFAH